MKSIAVLFGVLMILSIIASSDEDNTALVEEIGDLAVLVNVAGSLRMLATRTGFAHSVGDVTAEAAARAIFMTNFKTVAKSYINTRETSKMLRAIKKAFNSAGDTINFDEAVDIVNSLNAVIAIYETYVPESAQYLYSDSGDDDLFGAQSNGETGDDLENENAYNNYTIELSPETSRNLFIMFVIAMLSIFSICALYFYCNWFGKTSN